MIVARTFIDYLVADVMEQACMQVQCSGQADGAIIEYFEVPGWRKVQPDFGISTATSGRYFGEGWV
jgi:hypothetical protein